MINTEKIERLREIQSEIEELVNEAVDLLPERAKERAESYWMPHIITAIKNDHKWLGGSMVTLEDSINEIGNEVNSLIFTLRDEKEFDNAKKILDNSDFTYETNTLNSFSFEVDGQDEADDLESELQYLFDHNEISGYFESLEC